MKNLFGLIGLLLAQNSLALSLSCTEEVVKMINRSTASIYQFQDAPKITDRPYNYLKFENNKIVSDKFLDQDVVSVQNGTPDGKTPVVFTFKDSNKKGEIRYKNGKPYKVVFYHSSKDSSKGPLLEQSFIMIDDNCQLDQIGLIDVPEHLDKSAEYERAGLIKYDRTLCNNIEKELKGLSSADIEKCESVGNKVAGLVGAREKQFSTGKQDNLFKLETPSGPALQTLYKFMRNCEVGGSVMTFLSDRNDALKASAEDRARKVKAKQ